MKQRISDCERQLVTTELTGRSFVVPEVIDWIKLPEEVVGARSVEKFEGGVDKALFSVFGDDIV